MLVLYVASTGDGWEEFMWVGMDATGVDQAPVRNDFGGASTFFVAWMIVGCFVALNLFVGAIVDNFTRIKKETDGSAAMTPEQQQWADALRATLGGSAARAPKEPDGRVRRFFFRRVTSRPFEYGVMGVIVANVLAMAMEYEGMELADPSYARRYEAAMLFFTFFYYAEAFAKLIGLGPATYFGDGWCRFDFFLVCASLLDQFFLELLLLVLPVPPTMLRVLRVARVLRILRLVKNPLFKGLRDLALTLVYAFPAMINIGALLLLTMFIFAVLGQNLFSFVQRGEVRTAASSSLHAPPRPIARASVRSLLMIRTR